MYDWIALRRVSGGGVTKQGDCWFDGGRRVPSYVTDALAALREAGLVRLADLGGMTMSRAALTDAGATRYQHLCQQRHQALQAPADPSGATQGGRAAADLIAILIALGRLCPARTDSGRPPVAQPPRQTPPPGGRPDTTTRPAADADPETAHHGDTQAQS